MSSEKGQKRNENKQSVTHALVRAGRKNKNKNQDKKKRRQISIKIFSNNKIILLLSFIELNTIK